MDLETGYNSSQKSLLRTSDNRAYESIREKLARDIAELDGHNMPQKKRLIQFTPQKLRTSQFRDIGNLLN